MEENKIEDKNRTIAEFMGWKYSKSGNSIRMSNETGPYRNKDIHYHCSWDWLMPVAQKILQLHPIKGMAMEQILRMEIVVNGLMAADMCKIYFACIDFIEWYNSSNQLP